MKTQEKIRQVAKELITQKGAQSVTVSEVAEIIGISHQAAYKHFKNKKQLMESVALLWLDNILEPVFNFPGTSIHDWLWTLAQCKKTAYENDPEMFKLYTHYISQNADLENAHNLHLATTLDQITNVPNTREHLALIRAFIFFQHPQFAPQWDDSFQEKFEDTWQLLSASY